MVDALEDVTNLWTFGRDYYVKPKSNVYVPPTQTIVNIPDLSDDRHDDTSYNFGLNRISPYQYLNTLKSYKSSPPAAPIRRPEDYFNMKRSKWRKNRRISHSKMLGGFSTLNQRTTNEEEE